MSGVTMTLPARQIVVLAVKSVSGACVLHVSVLCPALQSPYLLPWMNHLWTGLWTSLVYTMGLQLVVQYYVPAVPWDVVGPDAELAFRETMTWAVLYGIFPAVLLGEHAATM
jgi:hypothetical protein